MLSVEQAKEKIDQAVALLAETGLYISLNVMPEQAEYLRVVGDDVRETEDHICADRRVGEVRLWAQVKK